MKIPLKRRSRSLSRSDIKGIRNDRSGDDFRGETVKGEGDVSADRVVQESRRGKAWNKMGSQRTCRHWKEGRVRICKEEEQIASHLPSFLCERGERAISSGKSLIFPLWITDDETKEKTTFPPCQPPSLAVCYVCRRGNVSPSKGGKGGTREG